jgi:hypothetical protein
LGPGNLTTGYHGTLRSKVVGSYPAYDCARRKKIVMPSKLGQKVIRFCSFFASEADAINNFKIVTKKLGIAS